MQEFLQEHYRIESSLDLFFVGFTSSRNTAQYTAPGRTAQERTGMTVIHNDGIIPVVFPVKDGTGMEHFIIYLSILTKIHTQYEWQN